MCGIVGIAVRGGGRVSLRDERIAAMRDAIAHRGPDGAGLWRSPDGEVVLGHRRLAVVDLSADAAQPMASACARYWIVYNGELYNDGELRRELGGLGCAFKTRSDTETLLAAWTTWGMGCLARLRGMFALAVYDTLERRLVLARDPLGIKPLVWWNGPTNDGNAIVFASEAQAVLGHPDVPVRPDLVTFSAYLTTIRVTLAERTLFEGVRTVRPGEAIEFDLRRDDMAARRVTFWRGVSCGEGGSLREAAALVRAKVSDSVGAHLRSDVPVCSLLSGGLDSSAVAFEAKSRQTIATYCSGTPARLGEARGDFEWAQDVASEFGVAHTSAPVDRAMFLERWPEMVSRLGVPLGTPNEVAINEVARRLRRDGCVVALSGEGADEVFGGYEAPMAGAWAWASDGAGVNGGVDQLDGAAWVRRDVKASLLRPSVWHAIAADAPLVSEYEREFAACVDECAGGRSVDAEVRWQARLRMLRRVNLVGLLGRLDTATMLEGVEGRTPLADRLVVEAGERLAMDVKWGGRRHSGGGASRDSAGSPLGKLVLREAYRGAVPDGVIGRAKASFPLPFERWLGEESAEWLDRSALTKELFEPAARRGVVEALRSGQGNRVWTLAWPMVNAALWARRWWN